MFFITFLKRNINSVILIISLSMVLQYATIPSFLGQSSAGFSFLRLGHNASVLAMSEAKTGRLVEGSIFTNPAAMAYLSDVRISANFIRTIGDVEHGSFSIQSTKSGQSIGVGIIYNKTSDIEIRRQPGEPDGIFDATYIMALGGYALKYKDWSLGISGGYLQEELYIHDASGYIFNVGILTRFLQKRVYAGLSINHIGKVSSLDNVNTTLPTILNMGVSYHTFINNDNKRFLDISAAIDMEIPIWKTDNSEHVYNDRKTGFNLGVDVTLLSLVSLRTGYKTATESRNFHTGFGIQNDFFQLDYAFVPYQSNYGNLHAITFTYVWQ